MIRIGLTAGDPAGIGLEVLLRVLPQYLTRAQWVLFGVPADCELARSTHQPSLDWHEFSTFEELRASGASGLWLVPSADSPIAIRPGDGSPESGQRALEALALAADHACAGDLDAVVTAPLSKRFAGNKFIGQTEFLRDRSGARRVAMSFFTPTFKVVLATTHLALRQAIDRLTVELYEELLVLVDTELRRLGYPQPRIAVAAVNPHAGEHGMFGSDEEKVLEPAVRKTLDAGLRVSGPWPADSCYQRAHAGEFDVVVAPYHDQGLIPVKLIAKGASANVTLGLPFVRTSPDHGTAFEIAGRGVAHAEGMESAIRWALDLVTRRAQGASS